MRREVHASHPDHGTINHGEPLFGGCGLVDGTAGSGVELPIVTSLRLRRVGDASATPTVLVAPEL